MTFDRLRYRVSSVPQCLFQGTESIEAPLRVLAGEQALLPRNERIGPKIVSFSRLFLFCAIGCALVATPVLADTGSDVFQSSCSSCHRADGGGVANLGPNLTDDCFINGGSQADILKVITEGSARNPMMVAFKGILTDEQITALASHIHALKGSNVANGKKCEGAEQAGGADKKVALEGSAERGELLFQGLQRFENRGPSCISCHTVRNDAVISGGLLGPELTQTLDKLDAKAAGQAKVEGFVQGKPVMQQAYGENPLRPQEIADLAEFLVKMNAEQERHMPGDTGLKLAVTGGAGCGLLLLIYSFFWRRRKRQSVNKDIYERQIKSSDL
ncbi:MAG: hypothetical protein CMM74_08760 [Rhodospirillaceae bacterium]|nr:hypothetical protein [Rhodospirillaceae bacterium]